MVVPGNCRPLNLFHERQVKQMCLLHALNNLLQERAFSKTDLDSICLALDERNWFNPHRSVFGLGNYDVNVLMTALGRKGLAVTWFDNRLSPSNVVDSVVVGYIFNKSIPGLFSYITGGRHWFTVLRVADGRHFNFDSKLARPCPIDNFSAFIQKNIDDDNQILLITKQEDADKCISKPNSSP